MTLAIALTLWWWFAPAGIDPLEAAAIAQDLLRRRELAAC
jgi:hypothetical protein